VFWQLYFRKEKKYQRFDLTKLALDPDGFGIESSLDALTPPLSYRQSFRLLPGEKLDSDDEKKLDGSPRRLSKKSSIPKKKDGEYIPLKDILEHEHYRRYFKMFCASEFSPENIMFFEAVNAFHSSKDIPKHAKHIYSMFFDPSSDLEVNIDHSVRKGIEDQLEDPTQEMYDVAMEKVNGTCIADQYYRFIYSTYYGQMTEKRRSTSSFLLYK
jgi:hypothetical protein